MFILFKKGETHILVCCRTELFENTTKIQVHHISFCNWFWHLVGVLSLVSHKRLCQGWILIEVHDFNTLLVQEKVQLLDSLRLSDTHKSRECVLLENQYLLSISQVWIGSGCNSHELGWPPTPAWVPETTHAHFQGRLLCLEHVSRTRSKCVCLG